MSKTVVQQMIDFVTSDEYNHLYPNVKQEWFNTFLEKEKLQTNIKQGSTQDKLDVLKKHGWDGRIPYEDTITIHTGGLLDAMQEYADHFKVALKAEIYNVKPPNDMQCGVAKNNI